ncbi:MAG: phage GP46 family protein [Azonexus sp.]|jgi:phage gp46-like protein|nr:phage GP46 family protein [Azonexus sp.]
MADIRTIFIDFQRGAEWLLDAPGLATDEGLDTAVILSLFTDARAQPDDVTPAPDDKRGWWGDAFAAPAADRFGSRLWLLGRRKQLPSVLAEARGYAEEALAWLIADGIASRVEVDAFIPRPETLGLTIAITRPNGEPVRYRFEALWSAL